MSSDKMIFKVIKSMTMNEKRYFKIFCKQHSLGGQNKYVLLFDLIDDLNEFDEKLVKEALHKKDYSNKYLSSDINYLTRILMKALNEFHSEKTFNLKIKQQLISIEILFYKGLYEECLNLINKTKRIKLANENHYLMLELLSWEKKCIGYSEGLLKAIEVNQKIGNYFNLLKESKMIAELYYQSYYYKNNIGKISKDQIEHDFNEVLKSEALLNKSNQSTIATDIYYNLIYSNYYHVIDDNKNEMVYLRKVIALFDKNEVYKHENPLDYISVYIRIVDINKNNSAVVFYADLNCLRSFNNCISLQKGVAEERVFLHTYQAELEYLININQLDKAFLIMRKMQETLALNKYNIEPYYMISLYHIFASIYCLMGNFSYGLKYINKILNEHKIKERPEIFIKAEIMNVIIHYELKNYTFVLKSIYEVQKRYKSIYKFSYMEKELFKTIIKNSENPHIVNEKAEFSKLKLKISSKLEEDKSLINDNYIIYISYKTSYR